MKPLTKKALLEVYDWLNNLRKKSPTDYEKLPNEMICYLGDVDGALDACMKQLDQAIRNEQSDIEDDEFGYSQPQFFKNDK